MAPSPQETVVGGNEPPKVPISKPLSGDEVVISGMSGLFPKSESTLEFMENLYNKVDMTTAEHGQWEFSHSEVPKHLGVIDGVSKFDAQFFRVHYKQACTMEPMSRKLLEHAYSAIFDSGINPLQLRGTKVGVFIGSTFSESEQTVIYENVQRNGFGITGCNRAMYANRISYWIDGKGPSFAVDVSDSSSMACLEHAYRSISSGQCDAAIVGGCNLCRHPNVSLNLRRAGFLCLDGKTKVFDKNGDGYVRSDAISVLFLQKAKDAKRIYTEVYYARGQYSSQPHSDFVSIRQSTDIQEFVEKIYSDINVSPNEVEYVEANGVAIAEADGNELEAIGKIFGKEKPIKVGSVKSNMGHSEPASGVCSLTKICLAYHTGKLSANLHYNEPQDHIPSVRDGRVQVLKEHTQFNRGFSALNSFSFGGVNIHVLLKGRYKQKDLERYKSSIPHLVPVSGRQEFCVKTILDSLETKPLDPEQIGLLHSIYEKDIPGHMCRGYTILDTNENMKTVSVSKQLDYSSGVLRPIWFVYSGMGSQWAGMGADLMRIPIFASAIQRCHKVLEPKGIDIIRILTEPDKKIYDNILNSFVGIAAVQIGLTDILKELGIVPDNVIGHSVGELGCAYADGCFTAEEMILSAYSRGLVSIQTEFIRGSMAAVGLGYKDVLSLCPPEIEVACHNSSESATISGPADIMKEFVVELTKKGVFAKEVPCSNIAYHSRYIASAGPGLLKHLRSVIKDPKPRSKKWVSTSVPQEKWGESIAKYSSAEYHTNNLLSSVLFEETSKLIPENALVIEVAPHGLLQAILKRSHRTCIHVPLTRRGHSKNVEFFLQAIGNLYKEGFNPKVDILYPKIEYPVSTETPLLSHLVKWEHSENWAQAKYDVKDKVTPVVRDFVMSIHDDDFKYFQGHVKDGAVVFPEAALLVLVWESLAMYKGVNYKKLSVVFRDVKFHSEAHIKSESPFKLFIMMHRGDNVFEVTHDGVIIMTGVIVELKNVTPIIYEEETNEKEILINANDFYEIMHLRGYYYKDEFQSIISTNANRDKANIKWANEWVTFLDSLIQLNEFARDYNGISVPKFIKKLTICTDQHKKEIDTLDSNPSLIARINKILDVTRCAGVELTNITFVDKPRIEQESEVLETGSFIPHFPIGNVDMDTALLINLQIIADNISKTEITITNIDMASTTMANTIKGAVLKIPTVNFNIKIVNDLKGINTSDVFVVKHWLQDEKKIKSLHNVLPENTFVLTLEENTVNIHPKYKLFNVISVIAVQNKKIVLLNKADDNRHENIIYIPIHHDDKFEWVSRCKAELKKTRKVVLVSDKQPYCGLKGLVKNMNKLYKNKVNLIIVDDDSAPSFNPEDSFYMNQLQKNLRINVLKKGLWGGYYYLPSSLSANIQNVKLTCTALGDLDSLTWVEEPPSDATNTVVQVFYAGPSFRDAQKAVGNIRNDEKVFGMDFSGINSKGEKVMGLISAGALASTVEADSNLLWPVPEHWSLEDAATVPLPFIHTYYCLTTHDFFIARQKIFVNGGAGALGQAVISVCLDLNCTVYTTVSDIHKKRFLLKLFPTLNAKNIGCSRDDSYHSMFDSAESEGKRCSIVINCLSGPLREAAMKCVGFAGFFIDVSNLDMNNNEQFGMSYLFNERNYKAVNFSNIFKPENIEDRKKLQHMISEGIAKGVVKPISRVVYSLHDVSKAFRLLATSKQRGRVLIKMRDPVTLSQGLKVKPRMKYSSTGTYVVVCDESKFGIELIDHIVRGGARNVIMNSKTSLNSGYFYTKLALWSKHKASVQVSSENLQTEKGCVDLLKKGEKFGPIDGIIVVQTDRTQMTGDLEHKDFVARFNKTASVVITLDLASRNICSQLSHFVVINHASDNPVDEYVVSVGKKVCQTRNEVGLPALSFNITSLDEYGRTFEDLPTNIQPLKWSSVFSMLETCLRLKYNDVASFNRKQESNVDVFEKISRIFGIKKLEDIPEKLTLNDLCVNEVTVEEVKTVLREVLHINYTSKQAQELSIASLKELTQQLKPNSEFDGGLGAFFTFIDEDECMAAEPVIAMRTKLSNAAENEEDLDPKATYLMLVPGFEGHHQIFSNVCERVKVQAMTLQLSPDLTNQSISEMAFNIMKFIKSRFELKSKFYLLGYSFGVNVALELAALIEKEGHVGVVYCLDSSPDALKVQLDAYVGNLTETELQNAIIQQMFYLMTGNQSEKLNEDLNRLEDWSDKVEACVSRLRSLVHYSNQYKRCLLQQAYRRIQLARDYEPKLRLKSELVLMKGIPHPKAEALPEDYNLSKYTEQPVKVFQLEFDHPSTPYDCRVSNIVNRFLEKHILEDFENKCLCQTYLADSIKSF